jgi:hypothetical protein
MRISKKLEFNSLGEILEFATSLGWRPVSWVKGDMKEMTSDALEYIGANGYIIESTPYIKYSTMWGITRDNQAC